MPGWTEPVVVVSAPVVPLDPLDVYPSHIANYGRGGYQTADDIAARDAIPSGRLELGMVVCVVDPDNTEYRLTDLDPVTWTEVEAGTGGTLPDLDPSPAGTFRFAIVTIDAKGRVTDAEDGEDVASEATQQQILAALGTINSAITDLTNGGVTAPTHDEESGTDEGD